MDIPADALKIWTDNRMEELRYQYELRPDDLCIDLGAFRGEWAAGMVGRYNCRVIAVEPTSAILQAQGIHGIEIINKAAWINEGVREFGGSSYWTSANEGVKNQSYPCFDVLDILQQPVTVLKINVEGDEYELLHHIIKSGLIKNIKNIQVQFHQADAYPESYQFRYSKTTFNLSTTHKKDWSVPYVWESWSLIC